LHFGQFKSPLRKHFWYNCLERYNFYNSNQFIKKWSMSSKRIVISSMWSMVAIFEAFNALLYAIVCHAREVAVGTSTTSITCVRPCLFQLFSWLKQAGFWKACFWNIENQAFEEMNSKLKSSHRAAFLAFGVQRNKIYITKANIKIPSNSFSTSYQLVFPKGTSPNKQGLNLNTCF
jgi:hypothetical protein